jgi:hypothetical protein
MYLLPQQGGRTRKIVERLRPPFSYCDPSPVSNYGLLLLFRPPFQGRCPHLFRISRFALSCLSPLKAHDILSDRSIGNLLAAMGTLHVVMNGLCFGQAARRAYESATRFVNSQRLSMSPVRPAAFSIGDSGAFVCSRRQDSERP